MEAVGGGGWRWQVAGGGGSCGESGGRAVLEEDERNRSGMWNGMWGMGDGEWGRKGGLRSTKRDAVGVGRGLSNGGIAKQIVGKF